MMAEVTRSRTPSSGKGENDQNEKEFLAVLKRKNDSSQEDQANLKLKTRPLRNGNGLQIFLTREDDPAFFYTLDITEDDFRELKNSQELTTNFQTFPEMIFQLLDTCSENSQFSTVLIISDIEVEFKIQETGKYKVIPHLTLRLRKGNDAKVRT